MSRIKNAIISGAYSANADNPLLDIGRGGQQGWAPNLAEWVSNQAYVRRNLICILVEAPRMFQYMPDGNKWIQSLKSLVELHARSIEGFNAGLTVELDEHPVGGAGEMQQEVIDVKRTRSEPVFAFVEKYGRPIQTFLDYWIRYGLMDPDTKYALIGTVNNAPNDILADWYSMTCLFIEPDPTHKKVIQSWLTTNMFPKSNGEIVGKRDLTAASEVLNLSVEFTGLTQYGIGVNQFAQKVLSNITITHSDPFFRPAFVTSSDFDKPITTPPGVSGDVDSATYGYKQEAKMVGDQAVSFVGNDGTAGGTGIAI
jgi:hypothetical protein